MSNIKMRLCFSKQGALRFIGHLDFLRVFQQTIRRAGVPAAFSQGFNPHLLISFALPLPLGMESVHDYADLTLEKEMCHNEIVKRLNAVAPDGLWIYNAYPAENKVASVVSHASYTFENERMFTDAQPETGAKLQSAIKEIFASASIIVPKKTKNGIQDTDIRPDIFDIWVEGFPDGGGHVLLYLSAGSSRFLNPITVLKFLFEKANYDMAVSPISIKRADLYQGANFEEL